MELATSDNLKKLVNQLKKITLIDEPNIIDNYLYFSGYDENGNIQHYKVELINETGKVSWWSTPYAIIKKIKSLWK